MLGGVVCDGRSGRLIPMSPAKLQLLLQEALAHHREGRFAEAEQLYARARAAAPRNFDVLHLSGTVAFQQGRHKDAAELLRRALKLNPQSALCEMRLGLACAALGDHTTAEGHLLASLAHDANLAEGWCHLGATLKAQSRLAEARSAYERALTLKPDYLEAHDRLGALVCETDGFASAVPYFRRAVGLRPDHATGWANLGVALAQSGGLSEAHACFDRALALEPAHQLALSGRAFLWQETYQIVEAVQGYGAVLAQYPKHHEARSSRLLALHYLDEISREELFEKHAAFSAAVGELRTITRTFPNPPDPKRRLRVAFLSPDLRAHSVAYFLEPLLAQLDPARFEIFLYHDHARVDAMSARLQTHAAQWRNFAGHTHDAVEAAIRADQPDLLVDLAGHTGLNRLPLFARRLAPVQLTFLGYPDTTGLAAMDYRFVDAITDPEREADHFHTEHLVRFAPTAWSYAPPADAPEPRTGVADGPVTFGCFNNFSKVSDTTLRGWAQVLAAVPDSRLLLKGHGLAEPTLAERLRARLARLGVGDGRIELLGRTPGLAAHLALYARVDVALDTFPYHGTTTTCEALWMGVPVVTLAGDRHMSLVGASLLTAAGHPEWIARDWEDYARIAARLAGDPVQRARLRTGLREDLRRGPLLDHANQATRFGAALRCCWTKWCAQNPAPAA